MPLPGGNNRPRRATRAPQFFSRGTWGDLEIATGNDTRGWSIDESRQITGESGDVGPMEFAGAYRSASLKASE